MPVIFEACDENGGNTVILSTDCCGTCEEFSHRSMRSGVCSMENKKGEISIDTPHCCAWILKTKYERTVDLEVKKAQGLL